MSIPWSRRQVLAGLAAGAGLAARPPRARAAAGSDLRFLFVVARGGWDPTRVLATPFDNRDVDMEAQADLTEDGDLSWVSHPDRAGVDAFFESYGDRCLILNGMQVRSINHQVCTSLVLTGGTSGAGPDWPAILAADQSDRYPLPHLVLGGASIPGSLGASVARSGQSGQLEGLLSGSLLDSSDTALSLPSPASEGIVDRYLLRRAAGRKLSARGAADLRQATAYSDALEKAFALKDYRNVMDFTGGSGLRDQADVAVAALSLGLSRCVTVGHPGDVSGLGWDSHANNDATQSPLWLDLMDGLLALMASLDANLTPEGTPLADHTVVVVLSEMGRTPQLNATDGKDHWPYTSALLIGPGLSTGRVIGAFDDRFAGPPLDPDTGEVDADGTLLSVEAVGATLLQLGDVDPAAWVHDAEPVSALLA